MTLEILISVIKKEGHFKHRKEKGGICYKTDKYPDLVASTEKGNQVFIQNIGKGPAKRIGLLVKNYTDISAFEQLKGWNCSSSSSMQQVSCRYESTLRSGEEIILPLPVNKMIGSTLTVLAEYDLNQKNNHVSFSKTAYK